MKKTPSADPPALSVRQAGKGKGTEFHGEYCTKKRLLLGCMLSYATSLCALEAALRVLRGFKIKNILIEYLQYSVVKK